MRVLAMGAWEDGFAAGFQHGLTSAGFTGTRTSSVPRATSGRRTRTSTRIRKKNPALSRAMKKAYKKSHTKSGKFRKGWNQSRMLKYAHKIKK